MKVLGIDPGTAACGWGVVVQERDGRLRALEHGWWQTPAGQRAELTMIPKTTVEVADESAAKKILRLIDALEDNDDVQDVYANFDIPERVLEAVAS